MPNPNSTEHYGAGQSGYGAGRDADTAMGSSFRNQAGDERIDDDPSGIHTDERFTGRGGEGYWEDHRVDATAEPPHADEPPPEPPGPAGYTRSDNRIRESVYEALRDDDLLDAKHIEVVVKNGEVMLTGMVDDRWQRQRAAARVEQLAGVKEVQNQLRIRPITLKEMRWE